MTQVALLLGGNLGDVESTFSGVRLDLEREVGELRSCSEVFVTKAWGFEAPDFRNQAVIVATHLQPLALLEATQRIEERWGRDRQRESGDKEVSGERYCNRSIDIDIILYGDKVFHSARLTIPHPLMAEREFVLRPLAQVAPAMRHGVSGKSIEEMLKDLNC